MTTIDYDGRTDGFFPLVTNRNDLSVFEVFSNLQRHYLMKGGQVAQRFLPELSSRQRDILSLWRIRPQWSLEAAQS